MINQRKSILFLGSTVDFAEMDPENYSPVIRGIISLLLLFVTQRIESASLGGDITIDTTLTTNGSAYVVYKDLVVAENATLTIQSGVQLHFNAGVALQVRGSLQAKGNARDRVIFTKIPTNSSVNVDDLNVTAPYNDGIRLSGGKNYRVGRLEIFLKGRWGTVCHDSFDIKDAQVSLILDEHVISHFVHRYRFYLFGYEKERTDQCLQFSNLANSLANN